VTKYLRWLPYKEEGFIFGLLFQGFQFMVSGSYCLSLWQHSTSWHVVEESAHFLVMGKQRKTDRKGPGSQYHIKRDAPIIWLSPNRFHSEFYHLPKVPWPRDRSCNIWNVTFQIQTIFIQKWGSIRVHIQWKFWTHSTQLPRSSSVDFFLFPIERSTLLRRHLKRIFSSLPA
jgi:hypothetical protein